MPDDGEDDDEKVNADEDRSHEEHPSSKENISLPTAQGVDCRWAFRFSLVFLFVTNYGTRGYF